GESVEAFARDTSFAVLHGLYWLAANLSAARPLLLAIDDAHWADEPSLRWLTYLARRLDGLNLVLLVALRPADPAFANATLLALRAEVPTILRPALLSENAVGTLVRRDGQQVQRCIVSGGVDCQRRQRIVCNRALTGART